MALHSVFLPGESHGQRSLEGCSPWGCKLNMFGSVQLLSRVQLFATPWTVAHQAPLSMGFPRQEYRSGLPFASPGHLPDRRIQSKSLALAGRFFTTELPENPLLPTLLPSFIFIQSTYNFWAHFTHDYVYLPVQKISFRGQRFSLFALF